MGDAEGLFKIRSDDITMKYMDTSKMLSIKEAESLISSLNDDYSNKKSITWAVLEKSSGNFTGYFTFWNLKHEHCRAEIGYALNKGFWGKGYMSETLKIMINFAFNGLKLHSIEANVNPANEKSIKTLENAGFKNEAYFKSNYLFNGKYSDSKIYSLLESDIFDL